jgi:hypothetical protein
MSAVENTVGTCLLKIMLYCSPCNLVFGLWAQRADMECVLHWSVIQSPLADHPLLLFCLSVFRLPSLLDHCG